MGEEDVNWRPGYSRTATLAYVAGFVAAGVLVDRLLALSNAHVWAVLAFVLAAVAIFSRSPRDSLKRAALFASIAALGAAWHNLSCSALAPDDLSNLARLREGTAWIRGVLGDMPEYRVPFDSQGDQQGYTRTTLLVRGMSDGSRWHAATGRVEMTIAGTMSKFSMGDPVVVAGKLHQIDGPLNPGETDRRSSLRSQGIRLAISVDGESGVVEDPETQRSFWLTLIGRSRRRSGEILNSCMDQTALPFAETFLLGRRSSLAKEQWDDFSKTGTAHLLAISGLHLSAMGLGVGLCCAVCGVSRKRSVQISLLAMVGYATLVGWSPSVLRSVIMAAAASIAFLVDRPMRAGHALALAALLTLAVNPAYLFDIGCQLSFLAVAALIWGVPPTFNALTESGNSVSRLLQGRSWRTDPQAAVLDELERKLAPPWRRTTSRLGQIALASLAVSLAAWVVTAPLVAARFHVVSPIAIILNLILVPITSIALFLGGAALALGMLWIPFSMLPAWGCQRLIEATQEIVAWGSAQPWGHWYTPGPEAWWLLGWYVLLGAALVAAGLPALRGLPRGLPLALWCVVGLGFGLVRAAWPAHSPDVEVLAVGHGLSIRIGTGTGSTILYDCGHLGDPSVGRRVIAPALWARRVRRLDAIVLSHADADHINGLPDLLERFRVGEVWIGPGFQDSRDVQGVARVVEELRRRGIMMRTLRAGDAIQRGEVTISVLHPQQEPSVPGHDNNQSLVLRVSCRGRHCLFSGDLEEAGLASLTQQETPPIDYLLAPHHGSRRVDLDGLLHWSKAQNILVSQKKPADSIARSPIEAAAQSGKKVLRTWQLGAIRLRWNEQGISASNHIKVNQFTRAPRHHPSFQSARASVLPLPTRAILGLGFVLRLLIVLLGFSIGLAICTIVVAVEWGAWTLLRPRRTAGEVLGDPPSPVPVHIAAADGALLAGFWFPFTGVSQNRAAILLHGFAEDSRALLDRAEFLASEGWSVLLLDSRGRGRSQGDFITFGALESSDLGCWLTWLHAGQASKVLVWGRSLGAVIALKAAAESQPLDLLILESPYHDFRAVLRGWLGRAGLPGWLARIILHRARRIAKVALDEPSPLALAHAVRQDVLLLHGALDWLCPPSSVHRLGAALSGPKEVVEVADAGHNDVWNAGGEQLRKRVSAWLSQRASG